MQNTDNLHVFANNAIENEIRRFDQDSGIRRDFRPRWTGFGKCLQDPDTRPQPPVNAIGRGRIPSSDVLPQLDQIKTRPEGVEDPSHLFLAARRAWMPGR